MKIIISLAISVSLIFAFEGKIIFNDGTTIKGKINSVNNSSASITPEGLSFPEQIMIANIDTLKLDDGKLLIASNKVVLFLNNGLFSDANEIKQETKKSIKESFEIEYVIVPNWSTNLYSGYPIIRGTGVSSKYITNINPVFGLSIGSPYGIFLGDFFMNIIGEIAYYNFYSSTKANQVNGTAYQIGLGPGLFIGDLSISMTACTGYYNPKGLGFITGGSIDIPIGSYIVNNFKENTFVENNQEYILSLEIRTTSRANIIQKNDGEGFTYWMDFGISLGYEF